MNAAEKRKKVVDYVKSREGKNKYTQSDKRTQVDSGYSDCSSLQQRAYQEVGIAIGSYTGAQILKGDWIQLGGGLPDESLMQPGDELFFSTNYDNGRPYRVGHIEMYVGNGQISGHGSGTGPTRKDMLQYCKQRNSSGKPFIGTKRYIPNDGSEVPDTIVVPDTPMFIGKCTGDGVNVRKGPGTSYSTIKDWPRLNKNNEFEVLEKIGSWYMIRIAYEYVGYIYQDYVAKVADIKEEESTPNSGLSRTPQYVGAATTLVNVRTWAGKENPRIKSWPQLGEGNLVDVCDTVKAADGADWYYVRIAGKIYGFVSAKYIKRV